MPSGKDLRRRIASVKNTQQLTKAMKMVSAAKLRRAQEAMMQARPYANGVRKVVQLMAENEAVREAHPLLAKREVKKVQVILITSDRGLCGAFNANLQKRAERMYREEAKNYEELSFVCLGKRGYEYLKLRGIPVKKFYGDILKGATFASISAVAEEMMSAFKNGECDEVRIIFAEFRSVISQVVKAETLLPVSPEQAVDAKAAAKSEPTVSADYIFEPSQGEILDVLVPRYFTTMLFRSVLESTASEHGARMAAMDNASRSAGDVIKKLRLIYNNIRQAGITKELLEITSGAEAL